MPEDTAMDRISSEFYGESKLESYPRRFICEIPIDMPLPLRSEVEPLKGEAETFRRDVNRIGQRKRIKEQLYRTGSIAGRCSSENFGERE
jgi:hypothetical protein